MADHNNPFTKEAFYAMRQHYDLRDAILQLTEVERDLEWIWHDGFQRWPELQPPLETALASVRTATGRFRQVLGQLEREENA
jgi:hypothetical protein